MTGAGRHTGHRMTVAAVPALTMVAVTNVIGCVPKSSLFKVTTKVTAIRTPLLVALVAVKILTIRAVGAFLLIHIPVTVSTQIVFHA